MSRRLTPGAVLFALALTLAFPATPAAASQAGGRHAIRGAAVHIAGPHQRAAAAGGVLPVPTGVGVNLQLSPADRSTYSETAVVQDPTNHGHLLGGSNVINGHAMAAFHSPDGGATWASSLVPMPAAQPNDFASDPSLAFDRGGTGYYSYIALQAATSFQSQLMIARSTDGGATWGRPALVDSVSDLPDKPLLAVDTTSGPHANRIYLAYSPNDVGLTTQGIAVSWSDNGTGWSRTAVVPGGENLGAQPVIDAAGAVYLAWDDYGTTPGGQLRIAKSIDGGLSFSALGPAPKVVASTSIGFGAVPPNYSNNQPGGSCPRSIGAMPSLDVDRSGTATGGNLYMAWNDEQPLGSTMHTYFSKSSSGGQSWSAPIRIDAGNPHDGWEPAVAVDQSSGMVTVAWYDRRDDPANKLYRVYYTQSADGGNTFLPGQQPLATAQSDPTIDCNGTGDYMWLSAADGFAHPLWSDTRNGFNQIFSSTVSEWVLAAPAATDSYFDWYDNASPGMSTDNIHLVNPTASSIAGAVLLGGLQVANFQVPAGSGTYLSLPPQTIGGPVRVAVTGADGLVASQRVVFDQSFNEVQGRSSAAAAGDEWFNWYDNASVGMVVDNIHLVNPGGGMATGTITLLSSGASVPFSVGPNGAESHLSFPQGTIGGPVRVHVDSGPPILASQRVVFGSSFNEVPGHSLRESAQTEYFNWYDLASGGMTTDNIHILNPGIGTSTGLVGLIDSGVSTTFSIVAGGEGIVSFPHGTIGGPLVVQIVSGPSVIATQRVVYATSFNEVSGRSPAEARIQSFFTWYDNQSLGMAVDNVHILNPGSDPATGVVSITSLGISTAFIAPPGKEVYVRFPAGTVGGPVRVDVASGPPVIASQRVVYFQSFNEVSAAGPGP